MKHIEIVVPTLNRPTEIMRFLKSARKSLVNDQWQFSIRVKYGEKPEPLTKIVNELVRYTEADVVMVMADHLVMHSDCLLHVCEYFDVYGLDQMVGLNIENLPQVPDITEYCFFAMGREFLARFPNRMIFCPDYYHFYADNELGIFANKIGHFKWLEDAKVTTYHPNVGNAQRDKTYWESRKNIERDKETHKIRCANGFHWGFNFDRVNGWEWDVIYKR